MGWSHGGEDREENVLGSRFSASGCLCGHARGNHGVDQNSIFDAQSLLAWKLASSHRYLINSLGRSIDYPSKIRVGLWDKSVIIVASYWRSFKLAIPVAAKPEIWVQQGKYGSLRITIREGMWKDIPIQSK